MPAKKKAAAKKKTTKTKKKAPKRKQPLSGHALTGPELALIVSFYCAQPTKTGLLARIKKESRIEKDWDRKDVTTQTIANMRDEWDLEQRRLANIASFADKAQARGKSLLDDNLEIVRKMKGVIIQRLLKQRDYIIDKKTKKTVILDAIKPFFADLERFVRLESFLTGGPDSRPDMGRDEADEAIEKLSDSELKSEIKQALKDIASAIKEKP